MNSYTATYEMANGSRSYAYIKADSLNEATQEAQKLANENTLTLLTVEEDVF